MSGSNIIALWKMPCTPRAEIGLNIRDAVMNPKINFVQTFNSDGQSGLISLGFGFVFKPTVDEVTPCARDSISNRHIAVAAIRAITNCITNLRPDT